MGLRNGAELDVSETLGGTSLAVSGQRDTGNLAELAEGLADGLVGRVERKVANEQCVARRATLVTELLGTGSSLVLVLLTRLAEVDVEGTAIKVRVVESLLGGLCGFSGAELDVTKAMIKLAREHFVRMRDNIPLGAARLAVSDDAAALNRAVRREGGG